MKSGHIFEASAIEKYVESAGKCPVTGETLDAADLLPLKMSTAAKPRNLAATSIPGMMTLFQDEWDALILDMYAMKQQLATTRQELGHALYQHDAACRVIARLIKERDDCRAALLEARGAPVTLPDTTLPTTMTSTPVVEPSLEPTCAHTSATMQTATMKTDGIGLSTEVLGAIDATAKGLAKARKKRQLQDGCATPLQLSAYTVQASQSLHPAGRVCIDVHASSPIVATGGPDGALTLSECVASNFTVQGRVQAHEQAVTNVKLHPSRPLIISASIDGNTRIFDRTSGSLAVDLRAHTGAVTACSLHATGAYMATASVDRSWAFFRA